MQVKYSQTNFGKSNPNEWSIHKQILLKVKYSPFMGGRRLQTSTPFMGIDDFSTSEFDFRTGSTLSACSKYIIPSELDVNLHAVSHSCKVLPVHGIDDFRHRPHSVGNRRLRALRDSTSGLGVLLSACSKYILPSELDVNLHAVSHSCKVLPVHGIDDFRHRPHSWE